MDCSSPTWLIVADQVPTKVLPFAFNVRRPLRRVRPDVFDRALFVAEPWFAEATPLLKSSKSCGVQPDNTVMMAKANGAVMQDN